MTAVKRGGQSCPSGERLDAGVWVSPSVSSAAQAETCWEGEGR